MAAGRSFGAAGSMRPVLLAGALLAAAALPDWHAASQETSPMPAAQYSPATRAGILAARPSAAAPAARPEPGLHRLDVPARRQPLLFVPSGVAAGRPLPLVVLLHGAGADAAGILPLMQGLAEERRFLILVPQSEGSTWDVILGGYGPDVAALDRALEAVFASHAVDPARIAVAGFSDGASYALSMGLANGGLFTDILAFSPGFMAPEAASGRPEVFVSHGREDGVLPIDRCSRRIVPRLRGAGYAVEYREFEGGHIVPPEMVRAALDRFLGVQKAE